MAVAALFWGLLTIGISVGASSAVSMADLDPTVARATMMFCIGTGIAGGLLCYRAGQWNATDG